MTDRFDDRESWANPRRADAGATPEDEFGRDGMPDRGASRACEWLARRADQGGFDPDRPLEPDEVSHLAVCAACRREATAGDPAAVFAVLACESKPDAFWTGFETRVLAEIRADESRRASGWGILAALLRPRAIGLALGAAAILAFSFVLLPDRLPEDSGGARGPSANGEAVRAPSLPGESIEPGVNAASGSPEVSPSFAVARSLPQSMDAAPPAPVEDVSSPTARVLSMNVTDQSDVVVIVGVDI